MVEKARRQAAGVLVLLILAGFGLTYWREIWAVLTQPQARDAFIEFVRGKGALGVFIFLGIQLLQVVVAFLPGEAVELAARPSLRHMGRALSVPPGYFCCKLHGIFLCAAVRCEKYMTKKS